MSSEDDFDAELLALAGDGSEDEGEEIESPPRVQDVSPRDGPKTGGGRTEDPGTSTRGVAQKVRANRRRKRRQESEEEDDFGGDG